MHLYMRAQGGTYAAVHYPPPLNFSGGKGACFPMNFHYRTLYKVLRGGGPKKITTK